MNSDAKKDKSIKEVNEQNRDRVKEVNEGHHVKTTKVCEKIQKAQ